MREIESELRFFSNQLVKSLATEFAQDNLHNELQGLKQKARKLIDESSLILKKEKITLLKNELESFQEILKLKKATIGKKSKIHQISEEISKLETEIEAITNNVYGFASELFKSEEFKEKLIKIRKNLNSLLQDESQLSMRSFDSISEEFERFKDDYASKKESIANESNGLIKNKLIAIKNHCIIQQQENKALSDKINSLLSTEGRLTKNQLNSILIEFYSIKL